MQAQGDVGVLGGVAGGVFQADLGERDLLGALAADVFVLDGVVAEIALGQAVHVVAGTAGIEHEALQQGVVGIAGQRHAMPAHHVQVVLAVLAELAHGRVGEQWRQLRQCLGAVELGRRTGK